MALSEQALTTLAALKAALNVNTGADDERLELLIEAQSARLAGLIGRALHYDASVVERLAGVGSPRLTLSRTPVVSVASVERLSTTGAAITITSDSYWLEAPESGFLLNSYGVWDSRQRASSVFDPVGAPAPRLYQVTYAGGWVTPGQAGGALVRNLPHDIEAACITLCAQRWRQGSTGQRVVGRSLMESSATYDAPRDSSALPPEVADVVARWSRTFCA